MEPDSRVLRECGSNITEVRPECYHRRGLTAKQSICECDISYCNDVARISSAPMSILLVVVPVFLAKYLFKY